MLKLDSERMHSDILKRLGVIKKPQRYLTDKLGVARSTFWRISKGRDITMSTFLILVNWLDRDLDRYIVKETKKYKPRKAK